MYNEHNSLSWEVWTTSLLYCCISWLFEKLDENYTWILWTILHKSFNNTWLAETPLKSTNQSLN